jgi:hypothetical protein
MPVTIDVDLYAHHGMQGFWHSIQFIELDHVVTGLQVSGAPATQPAAYISKHS